MKRSTNLLLILLITPFLATTQIYRDQTHQSDRKTSCEKGNASIKLKSNNSSINLGTSGSLIQITPNSGYLSNNSDGIPTSVIFASGIWMGGVDTSGITRFAGTTYKIDPFNVDWYCGPLNENGETTEKTCRQYDKIFAVDRRDIFMSYAILFNEDGSLSNKSCDGLPTTILSWPSKGNPFWSDYFAVPLPSEGLATFYDHNHDGRYNPCDGDMPSLETNGITPGNINELVSTFPEILTFNVINDNGSSHKLSAGDPMKMELHTYMFNYKNDDEINDMTFFKFKAIYKGQEPLNDVYFSIWVDPDLGCYNDDYLGTSSENDLVYIYEQDAIDGDDNGNCPVDESTFGHEPPILGFSFIKGFDIYSAHDSIGEWVNSGLTSSIYFNFCALGSPPSATCDPEFGPQSFYNTISGKWRNAEPITKGGIGYNPESTDTVHYVFDGNPANPQDWTMCQLEPSYADRRIVFSTGGSSMSYGSTNEAILAITLTKNIIHPCPDISGVITVNDKAKEIMNKNWGLMSGPYAPDLKIRSEDKILKFNLSNNPAFNNKDHNYRELIPALADEDRNYYNLEGYKVYQVNKLFYNISQLGDTNSVLVFQCDIQNNISTITNWEYKFDSNNNKIYTQVEKVRGNNMGILDSFWLDYDFLGNQPLQNNKEYYYVAVAYAYNNHEEFDPAFGIGQDKPFLQSKDNVQVYSVTSKVNNSDLMAKIVRLEGQGTYNHLVLSEKTKSELWSSTFDHHMEYSKGYGPFDIILIDSSKTSKNHVYSLQIKGPSTYDEVHYCSFIVDSTFYEITDHSNGRIYTSDQAIRYRSDQYFEDLGFVVSMYQPEEVGFNELSNSGLFHPTLTYKDSAGVFWFDAVPDQADPANSQINGMMDPAMAIEVGYSHKLNNLGYIFPFASARYRQNYESGHFLTPTDPESFNFLPPFQIPNLKLRQLNNVDLVFTSDKSKWSRCIVVESASRDYAEMEAPLDGNLMFAIRKQGSLDPNGLPDNSGTTGFSWFPGYAIDVETGDRLNVFFGENTSLRDPENSPLENTTIVTDMIFNPSSELSTVYPPNSLMQIAAGGQHFIYLTRQKYDGCAELEKKTFYHTNQIPQYQAINSISWTCIPLLKGGVSWLPIQDGLIPNDLTISLRATNHFFNENKNVLLGELTFCRYKPEYPLYQFSFAPAYIPSGTNPIFIKEVAWSFLSTFQGFVVKNVEEAIAVEVYDVTGKLINVKNLSAGQDYQWLGSDHNAFNKLIVTRILSLKSGIQRSYKSMIIWE